MQLKNIVEEYNNLSLKEKKIILNEIRQNNDVPAVMELTRGHLGRAATRILSDMGKKISEEIVADKKNVINLLNSDDPKIRINAAQIISHTEPALFLDNLTDALEKEQTMFVLPAYIKAIGAAKNDKAKNFLETYKIKSSVEKHRRAEKEALTEAKSNFIERRKSQSKILPTDIIMIAAPNLKVARREFLKAGINSKVADKYLVLTNLSSYNDLFSVRAFSDAYIYLGTVDTDKLPELIKKREKAILHRTGVTNYRLEIEGVSHKDRIRLITQTKELNDILINSPSSYSIELLAEIRGDKARLFLNPLTDNRFSYRKESVPASITGANAAAVCAFASEYFKPNARVLDNFCGSGTMLFERGYYGHGSLTGVDINVGAIEAARTNNNYAQSHPKFIHMDALKFKAKKFDEIITNMPFGLRVGNHSQNEKLYKRYIETLPSILTNNGVAVLYTSEKRLLENLLKQQSDLKLLKKGSFEAGGLNPSAYVLQKTV